jgi:hypothetical protein
MYITVHSIYYTYRVNDYTVMYFSLQHLLHLYGRWLHIYILQFTAFITLIREMITKIETEHRGKLEQLEQMKQEQKFVNYFDSLVSSFFHGIIKFSCYITCFLIYKIIK